MSATSGSGASEQPVAQALHRRVGVFGGAFDPPHWAHRALAEAALNQLRLDVLAFLYIVLRLLYIMMYVADLATVRTLVWVLALVANIAILFA